MHNKVCIERNVVYGKTDKELLTADVFRPVGGEDLPAVILLHGGAYQSGSKEMYHHWGNYLAESGFVAMAINYRLTTPTYSTWPGVIEDVRSAVNWLISQANEWNIEPQRIGLIGDSAGGHLAAQFSLLNATNASYKIRAVVGVYGMYDLVEECKVSPEIKYQNEKLIGAPFPQGVEKFRDASPINLIESAVANPIFDTSYFIIWGETDAVVDSSQSKMFLDRLNKAGVDTRRLSIPDRGHFWFNFVPGLEGGTLKDYPNTEVAPQVLDFLKEKLCQPLVFNFSQSRIAKLRTKM